MPGVWHENGLLETRKIFSSVQTDPLPAVSSSATTITIKDTAVLALSTTGRTATGVPHQLRPVAADMKPRQGNHQDS
jgi:hypothetical protein